MRSILLDIHGQITKETNQQLGHIVRIPLDIPSNTDPNCPNMMYRQFEVLTSSDTTTIYREVEGVVVVSKGCEG